MKIMKKIKVVLLATDLDAMGGISSVVREYLKGGLADKVDLHYIPTHNDGSILRKIAIFLNACCRLLLLAPQLNNSIVHLHTSQNGSFFRKLMLFCLAKLMGAKTLVHIHGSQFEVFMTKNALFRALTKFYFANADGILVLSKNWLGWLADFTENKNIHLVYNPVSITKKCEPNREGCLTILFMGKLGKRKGAYDILECICIYKDYFRDKNVKFILAGNGEVEQVCRFVADNDLGDLVEVPGWILNEQKQKYLGTSDILILPSYNEQMPMSILEAMGYGYPIIATPINGIADMVKQGENGILFEPGDIDAMTQALKTLIENAGLRERMGRKSQEFVKEKFENIKIVDQLVSIYQSL
jgi:glycosyltransferase involved in cell wall biosynthesis